MDEAERVIEAMEGAIRAAFIDGFKRAMWHKPWKQEQMVADGELGHIATDYAEKVMGTTCAAAYGPGGDDE